MEFFNNAKVVKLRSHLNKFIVADEDEVTVRQSRNGLSNKARWTVEMVEGKSHVIRLRSCSSGKYLTPSSEPFLTGLTGMKVVQRIQANKQETHVEWEPIKEGELVKLRAKGGKLLQGNGGRPPWRNSVTHDEPHRTTTLDWVLWQVDVVDIVVLESQESTASNLSTSSSVSSMPDMERTMANNHTTEDSCHRSPRVSKRQSGMEFFNGVKAVRLKSYHNNYLVADDDKETIRQSRNASSAKARWIVEYVEKNPNTIRLKSCHGLYRSATNEAFLLGWTGKKVKQYPSKTIPDHTTEWEPIREDAFHVKLQTRDGKFLRANGGTPPWRNSITHDVPHQTSTQNWVLWEVDVVDISLSDSESVLSSLSSMSSVVDSYSGATDTDTGSLRMGSLLQKVGFTLVVSSHSFNDKQPKSSTGMEFFRKAKSVRLRSHHDKYLLADSDGESVLQDRNGTKKKGIWMVELVDGFDTVIRLKSTYGKYLTASKDKVIIGFTGRKVVQSMPQKLDSSIEWEPIRDGFQVRLKTRYGNYLRANGVLPPLRNSITHDIPSTHDWILWDVETVEARSEETAPSPPPAEITVQDLYSSSFSPRSSTSGPVEAIDFPNAKKEGRMVYYTVADDDGNVDDGHEEAWFAFKGRGLKDLTLNLEELTGIDGIIVCWRNPLMDDKLYPLRLELPSYNATMHVVVVPPTSKVASGLQPVSTR